MMNKVADFFEAQAKREQEAKRVELNAMVEAFGIDSVLETMLSHLREINNTVSDVAKEENNEQYQEAKKQISVTKYYQTYDSAKREIRPVEFGEKTTRAFNYALKVTNTKLFEKGSGESKRGKVTNESFAKYIIEASGNDPKIMIDIINILKNAAWDGGYGITQPKMEIVYHTLILHRNCGNDVVAAITEVLKNYDPTSLKVTANQRDEYRNHLSYEEKMMMFVEDEVCYKIGEQPVFARETA